MGKGICTIDTWANFKQELQKQFAPSNAEKEAQVHLRRLKQSGSIWDYINEFTTLMLEISDMSDKDLLFYFQDGLKDWSKTELDRRGVQTLDDTIAIVESLTEYSTQSKDKKANQGKGERESRKDKDNNRKDWG